MSGGARCRGWDAIGGDTSSARGDDKASSPDCGVSRLEPNAAGGGDSSSDGRCLGATSIVFAATPPNTE